MPDNTKEFNIFGGGGPSFSDSLPALAACQAYSLPVTSELFGSMQLHSVRPLQDGERQLLPAYADGAPCPPPFVRYPAADTLMLLLHAPRVQSFALFTPASGAAPLTATRAQLSLLAGLLQAGGTPPGGPLLQAAAAEFAAGSLHKAHYLCSRAAAGKEPAHPLLCAVLTELGFYQEAYDILKTLGTPEAALQMAVIHRRTGNLQLAAKALASVPRGTPLEPRRAAEAAWQQLEAGGEDGAAAEFSRLSSEPAARSEALSGLAAALARKAVRSRDLGLLNSATAALETLLSSPCPEAARAWFQLGNLYFSSSNFAKAEAAYSRTAALSPGVQALGNLSTALMKCGKFRDAQAVVTRIALTDLATAKQLAAQLPDEGKPAAPPSPASLSARRSEINIETFPSASLAPADMRPTGQTPQAGPGQPQPPLQPAGRAPAFGAASLEPATPRLPPREASLNLESMQEAMATADVFAPREDNLPRKEGQSSDFISGAFRLASETERETGEKLRFSREGLAIVEERLLSSFNKLGREAGLSLVRDSSAFLCYFLQERHKGRLLPQKDLEPWTWPMAFDRGEAQFTSFPALRPWKLVLEDAPPEHGWLMKYSDWLAGQLQAAAPPPSGAAAVRARHQSHPERLADSAADHKRMLLLAASLPKTSDIPPGRPGSVRIGAILRSNFRPEVPPSADGWRLLRLLGHLLAEHLAADFKATWFNTDGDDGGWSMRLPWGAFVFPIGKVFKTAAAREDLPAYYDAIAAEKLRTTGAR